MMETLKFTVQTQEIFQECERKCHNISEKWSFDMETVGMSGIYDTGINNGKGMSLIEIAA